MNYKVLSDCQEKLLPYWEKGIVRPSSEQVVEYAKLLTDPSMEEAKKFVHHCFARKRVDKKQKEERKEKKEKATKRKRTD